MAQSQLTNYGVIAIQERLSSLQGQLTVVDYALAPRGSNHLLSEDLQAGISEILVEAGQELAEISGVLETWKEPPAPGVAADLLNINRKLVECQGRVAVS